MTRERILRWGGVASGGVLVAFGIAVIVLAFLGRGIVNDELEQQKIVGTPDMSPAGIKPGIEAAGLENVNIPGCDVAGKPIDSGPRARCFAEYMHIHALESSGGYVYAEMGQYLAKPGTPQDQLTADGATNNPSSPRSIRRPTSPPRTRRGTSGSPRRRLPRASTCRTFQFTDDRVFRPGVYEEVQKAARI